MNVRQSLLFTLLIYVIIVSTVDADSERVYRVGVEDVSYYPVQNFRDDNNKGVLASILRLFEETEGINLEFIPLPVHRFASWYDDGAIDLRIPDHPSWSSQDQPELIYSAPVLRLCESTIVLDKNADKSASELKSIGTLHGFTPSHRWRDRIAQDDIVLITDSSPKMLTRMLMNEMVDGLDLDYSAIQHQVEELGYDQGSIKISNAIPQRQLSYRMSTILHEDIIQRFNDFLIQYREEIIEIKRKHHFLSNRFCLHTEPDN